MPNMGFEKAAEQFAIFTSENPLVVSVAGFSAEDYLRGIEIFSNLSTVSAIECNFGCPNVAHGKIASFDVEFLNKLFEQIPEGCAPLWVKFSPYSDPGALADVAAVVNGYDSKIRAVVTCNTFPNTYLPDKIDVNTGLAGMSGRAMNAVALGQVRQFKIKLAESIDIIGIGGVQSGFDVVNMFEAGASGVQLTSMPFWQPNPSSFWDKLLEDGILNPYLKEKGYDQ